MDKALKQRLVGASVLIALAVVVLPMLLSGQPENQQEARSIEVPPKPTELSFETRRFPLGDQNNEHPSVVEDTVAREIRQPAIEAVDVQEVPSPQVQPAADNPPGEEVRNQASHSETGETSLPGRYLVQVASFSTSANANRLASRLTADGMSVMMDTIESAVGTLHRVRVGPFDQVGGANEAMAQIRGRTPDVSPRIIDLRPDESAPVTDPSDPLVRWVVQVGSFSDPANAESVAGQLRAAGFSAYTVAISGPDGTRYKVRAGPEIERQAAVQAAADIRSKLDLDGIVMAAD
jgi:DedD protein